MREAQISHGSCLFNDALLTPVFCISNNTTELHSLVLKALGRKWAWRALRLDYQHVIIESTGGSYEHFCKDVSKHDNSQWLLLINLIRRGVPLVSARLYLLYCRKDTTQRPRPGWKDNINMNHRAIICVGVNWIHLLQDRENWWLLKTK